MMNSRITKIAIAGIILLLASCTQNDSSTKSIVKIITRQAFSNNEIKESLYSCKRLPVPVYKNFRKYCSELGGTYLYHKNDLYCPYDSTGYFSYMTLFMPDSELVRRHLTRGRDVCVGEMLIQTKPELGKAWYIDDTSHTIIRIELFLNKYVELFKDVHVGMDTTELIKIFGKPDLVKDKFFAYSDKFGTVGIFFFTESAISYIYYVRYNKDYIKSPLTEEELGKIEILK